MTPPLRSPWVQHGTAQVQHATAWLPTLMPAAPPVGDHVVSEPPPGAAITDLLGALEAALKASFAEERARLEDQREAALAEAERWRAHALATETESRAQGFTAGYAEGKRQGRAAGAEAVAHEAAAQLDHLRHVAENARADLLAALRETQAQLAELSLAIAQVLVQEHFADHPERLARHIATLVERLEETTAVTIRLHPADLEMLRPLWADVAQAQGWSAMPRLVADDTIAPTGCVIATRFQLLDARPATILDQVRSAFAQGDLPADATDAPSTAPVTEVSA